MMWHLDIWIIVYSWGTMHTSDVQNKGSSFARVWKSIFLNIMHVYVCVCLFVICVCINTKCVQISSESPSGNALLHWNLCCQPAFGKCTECYVKAWLIATERILTACLFSYFILEFLVATIQQILDVEVR